VCVCVCVCLLQGVWVTVGVGFVRVCVWEPPSRLRVLVASCGQNDGKVYIDGGYLAYWVSNTTGTGLPSWVDGIECGAFVRVEDVEVVSA
jgi:hypothetical protein